MGKPTLHWILNRWFLNHKGNIHYRINHRDYHSHNTHLMLLSANLNDSSIKSKPTKSSKGSYKSFLRNMLKIPGLPKYFIKKLKHNLNKI